MNEINLAAQFSNLGQPWEPVTLTQYNGSNVMVSKANGAYPWHVHDNSDDMFLVLQGELTLEMRDCKVLLKAGEMFVVPQGIEHRPVAQEDAYFLLIEQNDINSQLLAG